MNLNITLVPISVTKEIMCRATFGSVEAHLEIMASMGGIASIVGPRMTKFSKATAMVSLPGCKDI